MVQKAQINFNDTVIYPETSADCVKYNGGNVKDFLDGLPSSTSDFMKSILSANSISEVRNILKLLPDNYHDELGVYWRSYAAGGDYLSKNVHKFGTKSLSLDGNSGLVRNRAIHGAANDPYTFECWARTSTNTSAFQSVFAHYTSDNNYIRCGFSATAGKVGFRIVQSGTAVMSDTCDVTYDVWHHFAFSLDGSTVRFFLDGKLIKSATFATPAFTSRTFYIGHQAGSYFLDGYIDEFRISNTCRYTANFTPQTAQFSVDDYTLSLLHFDD